MTDRTIPTGPQTVRTMTTRMVPAVVTIIATAPQTHTVQGTKIPSVPVTTHTARATLAGTTMTRLVLPALVTIMTAMVRVTLVETMTITRMALTGTTIAMAQMTTTTRMGLARITPAVTAQMITHMGRVTTPAPTDRPETMIALALLTVAITTTIMTLTDLVTLVLTAMVRATVTTRTPLATLLTVPATTIQGAMEMTMIPRAAREIAPLASC